MTGISIIMPLYNAAKYLRESLESILCQSFTDFELICINDGASDTTMEILNIFAQKDDRVRLFDNGQRKGAAYSRNKGLGEAQGEFVIFLDGDDIFDEILLEKALHTMQKYNSDIVLFDYMHISSDNIHEKRFIRHGEKYKQKYCRHTFSIKDSLPYEIMLWSPATCNKMYKRRFLLENELQFQNIQSSNDVYFSYMALFLSERTIVIDDERVMVYARDHSELSRISNNRNPLCGFMAMEKLQQELIKRNKFKDVFQHFYYLVYFFMKSSLLVYSGTEREKVLYEFLQVEGIDILCKGGKLYLDRLDGYIKQRITLFQKKNYLTKWYEVDNLLDLYLKENKGMVCDLFYGLKKGNRKICIWGAGRNGYSLINFLKENDIEVNSVVDKDIKKQGNKIGDYIIFSPEQVKDGIDVVIVSSIGIIEYVRAELDGMQQKQIEMVDINMFLGII